MSNIRLRHVDATVEDPSGLSAFPRGIFDSQPLAIPFQLGSSIWARMNPSVLLPWPGTIGRL